MANDIASLTVFNIFILFLLLLDLFVFHPKVQKVSFKEALWGSFLWIGIALVFNLYIYYSRGFEDAVSFFTAYLVEKSLSVDNLFVFMVIFKYFKTPESSMRKVLFWGILGAIILRSIFILVGIVLISTFHWLIYVFGLFLIFTGIKLWFEEGKEVRPEKNPVIRLFNYFIPVLKHYEDDKFFVLKKSRYVATPLFIVLLSVETTDVIFALDSIPAVLAITYDPFIAYTSNIFAVLGLRSLYFVVSHMLSLFHYLPYGLSIILVFVGSKMLMTDIYKIPTWIALLILLAVLVISIFASILFPKKQS